MCCRNQGYCWKTRSKQFSRPEWLTFRLALSPKSLKLLQWTKWEFFNSTWAAPLPLRGSSRRRPASAATRARRSRSWPKVTTWASPRFSAYRKRQPHDRRNAHPHRPRAPHGPLLCPRRAAPDLFGAWCFIREWGRIGRPGQLRHVPYPTEDEAKEALARQRRAKERRGYRSA